MSCPIRDSHRSSRERNGRMGTSRIERRHAVSRGITPHGGTLVNRRLSDEETKEAIEHAGTLPRISLTAVARSDLRLIGDGAFSPLTGFMGRDDYEAVIDT